MPHDLIERVTRVCDTYGLDPGGLLERPGSRRGMPVRQFRFLDGDDLLLDLATDRDGARRLQLEAGWRGWAADHGVPVPLVVAAEPGGQWLLAHRVEPGHDRGPAYVGAAVEAAHRIARVPAPAAVAGAAASSWRAPRRSRLVRGSRTVAGGVSAARWAAARRQWRELAGEPVVAHGDLHRGNVLNGLRPSTRPQGAVSLVDWEFAGVAPSGSDLARLWTTVATEDDRALVLEELVRGAGRSPTGRRRVGAMLWWHALRLLGENLSAAPRHRTRRTLEHARHVVGVAEGVAAELGAKVR